MFYRFRNAKTRRRSLGAGLIRAELLSSIRRGIGSGSFGCGSLVRVLGQGRCGGFLLDDGHNRVQCQGDNNTVRNLKLQLVVLKVSADNGAVDAGTSHHLGAGDERLLHCAQFLHLLTLTLLGGEHHPCQQRHHGNHNQEVKIHGLTFASAPAPLTARVERAKRRGIVDTVRIHPTREQEL
ncbi:cation/multidrug efflux pump [Rothia mucilaginosa DY-18]|uniref:Cation/multidrug efflux pump n=1 Tax=Rothia mucilaginosa (strain DY-18) TaxID=680646 RepID=D2NT06_ROTMD|nr:cation/multidrug efflux pump [Rothia mucilaginosa DY-18]